MLIESDDPPAVPLWINGHAYLTMVSEFVDIRNRSDRQVLRRTPLCPRDVADKAVEAAQNAKGGWSALSGSDRRALFLRLADALDHYAEHLCGLIAEETGKTEAASGAEVAEALTVLREADGSYSAGQMAVVAIVGEAGLPLLGPLRLAIPELMAGSVVVMKSDPSAPSVLVALAELTGRCGFPAGVFNVVHGGDAVLTGFRELAGVRLLFA